MKESLYDSHHLYCKKIIPMGLKLGPQNREVYPKGKKHYFLLFCERKGWLERILRKMQLYVSRWML